MHIYIFVLNSLSTAQQAVQACHACLERASIDKSRLNEASIVLIGVDNLEYVSALLRFHHISYSEFREPDLDNIVTSICTEILTKPMRKLLSKFTPLEK